ncbi:MAG: haloacid dehalogenase-like hydrolase [Polyangiales bacterium]
MRRSSIVGFTLALTASLTLSGCPGNEAKTPKKSGELRELSLGGHWLAANRAAINGVLATYGRGGAKWNGAHRPVATIDWDNTMMKNDLGDATLFWMLRNEKILQPVRRNWQTTSKKLTYEGNALLNRACNGAADPGRPLATAHVPACADAILTAYLDGATKDGAKIWTEETTATTHQPYAWAAQIMAGYTADEQREFAKAALAEAKTKPLGTTFTVGTRAGLPASVQLYDEMKDLVGALQDDGFEAWIVSASPQTVVEVAAAEARVDRAHVIGIRTIIDDQLKATARLVGCATIPDGDDTIIPFSEGKRCWINRAVFELPPNAQLLRPTDPATRAVFAAGDSDGDVAMLQDASALKLVLNRGRLQVMCNAYANAGNTWRVQPMFLGPAPRHVQPFPCAGAVDAKGDRLTEESGAAIGDQFDSVYALP